MKNRLYIIFVISLVWATPGRSQNFLELGKKWIFEDMHYSAVWFPYSDTTIETITIAKDTVINAEPYKKVVTSRNPSCWDPKVVEYLREDGDKLYRLSRDHQQEYLMIDFGETSGYQMLFDTDPGAVDTGTVIIDSFGIEYAYDGTMLQVQYLRILNNQSFDDDAPYKVYKNIGFLQGGLLFPDLGTGLCDFQDGITLRCVTTALDTIHFTEFDCFELQIINNVRPVFAEAISLSPNPTSDYVSIPSGYFFLDIYDLYGKFHSPDFDTQRIYLNNCPVGSYVMRFTDSTKSKIYVGLVAKI